MNDVEHELRELFGDKARDARIALAPPAALLKRGRRRQVGTVAIGAVTALLVVVASVAALRTVGSGSTTTPAAPNDLGERTATVQNFTLTAPAGWTMIDWWPFSWSLATTATGVGTAAGSPSSLPDTISPSATAAPSDASLADMVPVLQVSTFDPGLDATLWCGTGGQIGGSDALLYVALDAAAMRSGQPLPPPWPVDLQGLDAPTDGPCGPGAYARFSLGGVPYLAFVAFGSDVSSDVRQRTIDVFDGTQANDVAPPVPAGLATGYVVAAGIQDGEAWRLELGASPPTPIAATTSFVFASVIAGSEDLRGRAPLSANPVPATAAGVGGAVMMPVGSAGVAVGSVVHDAATVEYVAPDGTQSDLALVEVPASLATTTTQSLSPPDRVFWGIGDPQGGEIVQLGADGTELLRQRIIVLDSANGGSSPSAASGNQLAYDIPDGGPITAVGAFQGTDWKVEVLFYKDGVRLTIGGTPEDLGVMRSNEPLVRPIGNQGYGALVLVLTDLSVDRVAITSEGSWEGRWLPASTGAGGEMRLWVLELPGAGTGSLELNGQPSGSVRWP